jgi:hypothetical protein
VLANIALLRLMVGVNMLMGGIPGLPTMLAWFPKHFLKYFFGGLEWREMGG